MKKQYTFPKAEKVVFDYTESVVACMSDFGWCKPVQGGTITPPKTETQNTPTVDNRSNQGNNTNKYWVKTSTDYWGC